MQCFEPKSKLNSLHPPTQIDCNVPEVCDGESLWLWSPLEISINNKINLEKKIIKVILPVIIANWKILLALSTM